MITMHTMRRTFGVLLALGFLLLASPTADAQDMTLLDDTWFKLKATGKCWALDEVDGSDSKASMKATAYMHLTLKPADDDAPPVEGLISMSYEFVLYTQDEFGLWVASYSSSMSVRGNETGMYFADEYFKFFAGEDHYFGGYMAGRIINKLDSKGDLRKAKFQSLGAELIEGRIKGTEEVFGGYKVKGTMIPVEKLPFPVK